MKWDTPIRQILPDFKHVNETINHKATIIDFMSHRTGLAPKNRLWAHEFAGVSLRRKETLKMTSYLETVFVFRTCWLYNNWVFAVADQIMQRLSGQTWGTFLQDRILTPFGLTRTTSDHSQKTHNVAQAYMALSNVTPFHLPWPGVEDGVIMEGAVGLQSSVRDLLIYAQKMMEAEEDQKSRKATATKGSPLKQVPTLTSRSYRPIADAARAREIVCSWLDSYDASWISRHRRTQSSTF